MQLGALTHLSSGRTVAPALYNTAPWLRRILEHCAGGVSSSGLACPVYCRRTCHHHLPVHGLDAATLGSGTANVFGDSFLSPDR